MAHPNEELIDRFYAAFGARDGAAMSALYAPDARFSDPVFTDLSGDELVVPCSGFSIYVDAASLPYLEGADLD